ncbi:C39 family peptidase [bacterium]|nr:C39 family peptidase [bacterium]
MNTKFESTAIRIITLITFFFSFSILFQQPLFASSCPDQHFIISGADSLLRDADVISNITISADGNSLQLPDSVLSGYIVLRPQHSDEPFNRGLPSWNGTAPDQQSSFKVQMRFRYGSGWSSWLTAGYWKNNIWSSYGSTSFSDGYIDIDYVKMYTYKSDWQFKVILERKSTDYSSPTIRTLSFFVSDTRTTDQVNHTNLFNDNPEEIFIPTMHLYQYSLDSEIGGSICSPTTVSMILISYGINVEPVPFARATKDPYYNLFGVWPRVVQNASEYGVKGYVTQYRSWSQAREVLANGGRIAMSVGQPLYSGHLMMLAGFDENGNPLVHDPARSNGYGYKFNKTDLGKSWFDKGGISYTFYLEDSVNTAIEIFDSEAAVQPRSYRYISNYPNPFNNSTNISFRVEQSANVEISIYNINGEKVTTLANKNYSPGKYVLQWNGTDKNGRVLGSGIYFVVLKTESGSSYYSPMHFVK